MKSPKTETEFRKNTFISTQQIVIFKLKQLLRKTNQRLIISETKNERQCALWSYNFDN